MIEVADMDKDGRVNEEQFYHFMTDKMDKTITNDINE